MDPTDGVLTLPTELNYETNIHSHRMLDRDVRIDRVRASCANAEQPRRAHPCRAQSHDAWHDQGSRSHASGTARRQLETNGQLANRNDCVPRRAANVRL